MTTNLSKARSSGRSEIPTVVVICGPPCSGKTTIARQLQDSRSLAAFSYFEMDEIRLSLWPSSHTPQERAKAYGRMHELAAQALQAGARGVILVATYQPSEQRRAVRAMADALASRIVVFECAVLPDEAVERFQNRSDTHAGTDLSAEKVWDLAHDFRYFPQATRLDTSSRKPRKLIHTVATGVSRGSTTDLEQWILYGNPPRTHADPYQVPSTQAPRKLTARSRKRASRLWALRRLLFGFSVASGSAAVVILAKQLVQLLIPALAPFGFRGEPAEWFQIWTVGAVLASGLLFLYEQLFDKADAKDLRDVREAGQIPRHSLHESPPSNMELYSRYRRRIVSSDGQRLPLEGVPLWFVVLPRARGFEVYATKTDLVPIDTKLLQKRAAAIGLDWSGYLKWRKKQKMDQYLDRYHEIGVRALDIKETNDSVTLTVCKGSFVSHVCTELSANLYVEGRFGFELRQVFEGDGWIQSNRRSRRNTLDLGNVRDASRGYEMLTAVQVALTTADGYLILQRRSDVVQSAAGGAGSSGAGSAKWKDIAAKNGSLIKTALRETREEIGWAPHRSDDLRAPFLGAAFNLLWGRNLNFYCHFHTHWTLQEISAGPSRLHRVFRLLKMRPLGATRAADAWEVAHIIPIPIPAVELDGTLAPPFRSIVGDARHVRGLLYCLAQSQKFRDLRSSFNG